jgi:hypothetical protein
MLVAPWLMPVLPVRGRDVSVPLVPLSNVPLVVIVPVVFSVPDVVPVVPVLPEELFMSLDVLPELTEPELLLVLLWVVVDFFVVVVFFVPVGFVRLPDVCALSPAVMPASINAVKNAFFMIMYLIKFCCCIVSGKCIANVFQRQQVSASPGIRQQQYQNEKPNNTYRYRFVDEFLHLKAGRQESIMNAVI